MIRGIHHTAISTRRFEPMLAFYRDVLGFETQLDWNWADNDNMNATHALDETAGRVALLRLGNAMIELFEFTAPEPRDADPDRRLCDRGLTHLCLDVQDIEGEVRRLEAAGMRFHCAPVDYGTVKTTYGADPDGNFIELQEILSPDDPLQLAFPGTGAA